MRARESALRRQAKILQRHVLRRFVDALLQDVLGLERAGLGGDQAEHHVLALRQARERGEAAGALAVVLHEEALDVGREHAVEHFVLVGAGGEPGAAEIAAAGVHRDAQALRAVFQRGVDRVRVSELQPGRVVAVGAEVLAHLRIAQIGEADVVELQVRAAGVGEVADRLAPGGARVLPEFREIRVDVARDRVAPAAEVQ